MQSYKLTTRLPQVCKRINTSILSKPQTRNFNMSLFGSRFPQGDFAPLFRLLDDYDVHRSTSGTGHNGRHHNQVLRTFQPKFDVREEKENYLLNGELPGIEQKDISIEFTDSQTLVIKGRTEREYSSGHPNAIEGSGQQGRITEGGDHAYHKATVEDESAEGQKENGSSSTEVAKQKEAEEPKYRYWVSERSVGEFHRSFTFPGRVDQDAVKASLKNGILSVVVPKSTAKEARKIQIQ